MSLLRDIQAAVLDPSSDISAILLKLRFLASRLGSTPLEEWVKHEAEGYPDEVSVPDYRKFGVEYKGNWSGPFGSGITNAPIPSYLIEKFAGKKWCEHEMRQSIVMVDDLLRGKDDNGGTFHITASNLMLVLQGKVYEEFACNAVWGEVPRAAIREIQYAVRNRILEFTIQLEKAVPAAADVSFGKPVTAEPSSAETVTQIYNQTIHGHYTAVTNTGAGATITLSIAKGDANAVANELIKAGIPETDAQEFAAIVASEKPVDSDQPFGERAREWLAQNLRKAVDGTWKVGIAVATRVLQEATLRYYGLK